MLERIQQYLATLVPNSHVLSPTGALYRVDMSQRCTTRRPVGKGRAGRDVDHPERILLGLTCDAEQLAVRVEA